MLRPSHALPAILLLLDPHDCGARRRAARTTSEATTTETPAAVSPTTQPTPTAPDARDAGGTIALTLSVPPTPREATPERRAFFAHVSTEWMRRIRREPEGREDVDAYLHRDPNEPWSPPPWPVGLATSATDPREVQFVAGLCNSPELARDECVAGIPWRRHGIDRVCCFGNTIRQRRHACFDVTGRRPIFVLNEVMPDSQ